MVLAAILALGLASGLCACHSGSGAPAPASHLSLRVLEGTLADAPAGRYALREQPDGAGLLATLEAQGVQGLKALLVEVDFDPAQWQLAAAGPGPDFPPEALHLAAPGAPGTVAYGQVLPHYDDRPGFSGSGAVAVLRFAPAAVTQADLRSAAADEVEARAALATPPGPPLSWDAATNSVEWTGAYPGDYDLNGMVDIGDLSPVGRHFGARGPFEPDSEAARADGDFNGEVNLGDLTVIGRNYGGGVAASYLYFARSRATLERVFPGIAVAQAYESLTPAALEDKTGSAHMSANLLYGGAAPNGWVWYGLPQAGQYSLTLPLPLSPPLRLGSPNETDALPVALVSADPPAGPAPLLVQFDAAASYDPDGSVAVYEWDWTGPDDGWLFEPADGPLASHAFDSEGAKVVTLRVRDDEGALAFTHVVVNVQAVPNDPPLASLTVEKTEVLKLRDVELRVDELEGSERIRHVLLDRDGDGEFDSWGDGGQYVYPEAGDYYPLALVSDEEGAASLCRGHVLVGEDEPPRIVLNAPQLTGDAPLSLSFDVAGSTDDFGFGGEGITEVEWEYDNSTFAGADPDYAGGDWAPGVERLVVNYLVAGTYRVKVTIVDGAEQASSASVKVIVGGRSLNSAKCIPPATGQFIDGELIAGHPAAVYDDSEAVPGSDYRRYVIRFVRSRDAAGESWEAPVLVEPDGGTFSGHCSLLEVDGRPAVSWLNARQGRIYYRLGYDANGTYWSEPLLLADKVSYFGGGISDLELVEGNPAVAFSDSRQVFYRRALDAQGLEWGEPLGFGEGFFMGWPLDLSVVNGRPALAFGNHLDQFDYVGALDAEGQAWGLPTAVGVDIWDLAETVSLLEVEGRPALFMGGFYTRAADSAGTSWPEMTWRLGGYASDFNGSAILMGGRIAAVLYGTNRPTLATAGLDPSPALWPSFGAIPSDDNRGDVIDMGGYPGFFHGTQFSTLY